MLACTQGVLGHQVCSGKLCLHKQGLAGAGDLNYGVLYQGKGTRGTHRTIKVGEDPDERVLREIWPAF